MVNLSEKKIFIPRRRGEWPGEPVAGEIMLEGLAKCEKILAAGERFHYLFDNDCPSGRERRGYILRMIFFIEGSCRMTAAYDRRAGERLIHADEIAVGGRGNWNAPVYAGNLKYENYSVIFMHNLIRLVHSYWDENGAKRTVYCHYPAPGECLQKLLECANDVIADINNARSKRIRLLLSAILEQFKIDIAGVEESTPELPAIVEQAIHYIDLNYDMFVNCSTVAEALRVNRTQLSEIFHNSTGRNMKDYILDLRMEKACWLLLYPDLKINQIARECGFADAGYFIKVFRKKYQKTPLEYRMAYGAFDSI